jgi:hypothetical protein
MVEVDIGLIVIACVLPVILIFFNLVVMAHYIDPSAAAGHFFAKLVIVRWSPPPVPRPASLSGPRPLRAAR